jgi:hypothetical protein
MTPTRFQGLLISWRRAHGAPVRHGRAIGTVPRRNLAMAALSVIVATVALGIGATAPPGVTATPVALPEPGATPPPAAPPPTPGGPVPAGLRPSIAAARTDYPLPYADGCHVKQEGTASGSCAYGTPSSSTTIVLMGDSHALSWFPAVNRLATTEGWRLLNFTKSACASADVSQWHVTFKRVYTECDAWRLNTYRRIEAERPALVLIANSRMFQAVGPDGSMILKGAERTEAWRQGMAKTLARLAPAAGDVVLLGDTPRSMVDVPVCLSDHPDDTLACATPFERSVSLAWLAEEEAAAGRGGAWFVDPTPWVCPTGPCPAVIGTFMVFRDEHHLTTPFSGALWRRLGDSLKVVTALPLVVDRTVGGLRWDRTAFFPQDGDRLLPTATLTVRVARTARLTLRVLDASGAVVRTAWRDRAFAVGTAAWRWDGRTASGAWAAPGRYVAELAAVSWLGTTLVRRSVVANAFTAALSSTAPPAGSRLNVTFRSVEPLAAAPTATFRQAGGNAVRMTVVRLADGAWRATVAVAAGAPGPAAVTLLGRDTAGGRNRTTLVVSVP